MIGAWLASERKGAVKFIPEQSSGGTKVVFHTDNDDQRGAINELVDAEADNLANAQEACPALLAKPPIQGERAFRARLCVRRGA